MNLYEAKAFLTRFAESTNGHANLRGAIRVILAALQQPQPAPDPAGWSDRTVLVALTNALKDYVHYHGVEHDDPACPEDDTCTCRLTCALSDALDKAVATTAVAPAPEPDEAPLGQGDVGKEVWVRCILLRTYQGENSVGVGEPGRRVYGGGQGYVVERDRVRRVPR